MLKVVNAIGDACPIPVVKTKNAIKELIGAGMVETLVDNEIAVQNLTKMAQQKNYGVRSEKLGENQYRVQRKPVCRMAEKAIKLLLFLHLIWETGMMNWGQF